MGQNTRYLGQLWRTYNHFFTPADPLASGKPIIKSVQSDGRSNQLQIRFLGDPSGDFTKKLDLTFDSSSVFGNDRSKRCALVTENGKVKEVHVEPDNTGVNGTFFSSPYHLPLSFRKEEEEKVTDTNLPAIVTTAEKVLG